MVARFLCQSLSDRQHQPDAGNTEYEAAARAITHRLIWLIEAHISGLRRAQDDRQSHVLRKRPTQEEFAYLCRVRPEFNPRLIGSSPP